MKAQIASVLLACLMLVWMSGCAKAPTIAEIERLGGEVDIVENSVFRVSLANTQATDAALEHLEGMANLRALELNVAKAQVTDVGAKALQGNFVHARISD